VVDGELEVVVAVGWIFEWEKTSVHFRHFFTFELLVHNVHNHFLLDIIGTIVFRGFLSIHKEAR
jgi:hypothetical protein